MSNQELILQQPGYVQDQVGIQTNSIVQKSRMSVVSLSLIIAGVGFGLICLVGFLFNDYLYRLLLSPEEITEKDVAVLTGLMWASIIGLIVVMFMSMIVWRRINKCSLITIGVMMAIFIFSFGICLGTLFTSLQLQGQDFAFLISVFGIFGGIAFLTGIIGFTINDRAHLTLTKINYIASFVALLAIIVVIILGFFLNLSWIEMGLMSLFCVLSVLYLVWDFATLKRLNTYLAIVDDKTRLRYTMMFGFKLMQDLAMLFWYLLRIASMFGGRR